MKAENTGVILVDHGSRRAESNRMLEEVAQLLRDTGEYSIVEPAHMELAEPSIAAAFARCVERGASRVVVHPFFLFPGRHWHRDIPELVKVAAEPFPDVPFLVTAPLGAHPLMAQIMQSRIGDCTLSASGEPINCTFCGDSPRCHWQRVTDNPS